MSETKTAAVSINPATGVQLKRYEFNSNDEVETLLAQTDRGFKEWRKWAIEKRADVLKKMAQIMRRDSAAMAQMITAEMGKPAAQAKAEIEKCAALCDWYAENGAGFLQDEKSTVTNGEAYVSYLPVGAIFAVMPWNFPFWQVMRGAVAILLGGNAYVLKHSSNVMGAAYLLLNAWRESGLPDGVFTVVNIDHDQSSTIIEDRRIAAVTVTGSVRAGRAVAAKAGSVLKKSVLELGGADPFIVLADADLDRAVESAVEARFQNTGQVCIAAKRFIVEESVLAEFTAMFADAVQSKKVGDPTLETTYIGPMARKDLRDDLYKQVEKSVSEGAKVLIGGQFAKVDGFAGGSFYQPTILTGVKPGMTAFKEEMFGPVAAVIAARDVSHALDLANDSDFGLSSAIWSRDEKRARLLARQLETGAVYINGMAATDPRVPVGGVKQSGYGRELSHFGLREFQNAQTVWLNRK